MDRPHAKWSGLMKPGAEYLNHAWRLPREPTVASSMRDSEALAGSSSAPCASIFTLPGTAGCSTGPFWGGLLHRNGGFCAYACFRLACFELRPCSISTSPAGCRLTRGPHEAQDRSHPTQGHAWGVVPMPWRCKTLHDCSAPGQMQPAQICTQSKDTTSCAHTDRQMFPVWTSSGTHRYIPGHVSITHAGSVQLFCRNKKSTNFLGLI